MLKQYATTSCSHFNTIEPSRLSFVREIVDTIAKNYFFKFDRAYTHTHVHTHVHVRTHADTWILYFKKIFFFTFLFVLPLVVTHAISLIKSRNRLRELFSHIHGQTPPPPPLTSQPPSLPPITYM